MFNKKIKNVGFQPNWPRIPLTQVGSQNLNFLTHFFIELGTEHFKMDFSILKKLFFTSFTPLLFTSLKTVLYLLPNMVYLNCSPGIIYLREFLEPLEEAWPLTPVAEVPAEQERSQVKDVHWGSWEYVATNEDE